MKILAIESASLTASVAIVTEDRILAEYTVNHKKTHSETLLPMVERCLSMTDMTMADIDAVAVSAGPGSFTGLRIGASTAKGLAYGADKPIIPVPTLDAMAYGLYGSSDILCPIMDARRGEVYTGLYEFRDGVFVIHEAALACPVTEEAAKAQALSEKLGKGVTFLGDGLPVHEEAIRAAFPAARFAPAHLRFQKASSVATLGMKLYQEGQAVSAFEFLPVYLRESQAERERREMGLSTEPAEEK